MVATAENVVVAPTVQVASKLWGHKIGSVGLTTVYSPALAGNAAMMAVAEAVDSVPPINSVMRSAGPVNHLSVCPTAPGKYAGTMVAGGVVDPARANIFAIVLKVRTALVAKMGSV